MSTLKQSLKVLVIDDEPQVRGFIADVLRSDGWSVTEASSAKEAISLINETWLLIICDVMLGEKDGYFILRSFAERQSDARFVLMTGYSSAAGAFDATATGAYDYLIKPIDIDDILNISKTVRDQHQIRTQYQKPNPDSATMEYISDIPLIGKSPKFVECLKMVGRVATTNLPFLIMGESGTGKEIVAQAIHRRSQYGSGDFVAVNCSAIPVELIESELFGHAKGSFTGADRERIGLWEKADNGTIFLDEITETSLQFQVKLLRVLQQSEIRRVGSNRTIKVNVRVIAATNRNIEEEVREGRFRQDLMYRLNAVTIKLPPLRERVEDIPLLAAHFAKLVHPGSQPVTFSPAALNMLKNYNWPGNIRELENVVLYAISMTKDIIYPEHLPAQLNEFSKTALPININTEALSEYVSKWVTLAVAQGKYVEQVLVHTGGNKQAASHLLNIDRKTLDRIVQRNKTDN